MYRQASHRHLKNRVQKRRVSSHHYTPKKSYCEACEFERLRASQQALTLLKHKPELVNKLLQSIKDKQQQTPQDPGLEQWQLLLEQWIEGACSLESITEQVMGYDKQAKQLRESELLNCILD